ncbi:unnamed protein product [Brassicogethes aeneus]|uniref:Ninjurin-1 n=1 Tax=Brassicogethes aeneus TaxID=1431903 RepID=A0A9P0ANJ8_BRAAE|nr:unnamed protein product [Brassicogethes aeneus]
MKITCHINSSSSTVDSRSMETSRNDNSSSTIDKESMETSSNVINRTEKPAEEHYRINNEDESDKEASDNEEYNSNVDRIDRSDSVDLKGFVKEDPEKIPTSFAATKTAAQGMMDIALITANANQLRYVLEYNEYIPTYHLLIVLIAISLILQVSVGVCLIFKGRMDFRGTGKNKRAKKLKNIVVVKIFFITIINVFIACFTTSNKVELKN